MATCSAARGASRTGSSAGVTLVPGQRPRDRALGGTAAARAVVDVPDQLAAQGRAQYVLVVAGEAGDARAAAGLDDRERGAGALDLAGGGGEQFTGGGQIHAEDGGDLVGGEVVAHGEFEGLALLRGGAGGLRPGEEGEFAAVALLCFVVAIASVGAVAYVVRGGRRQGRGLLPDSVGTARRVAARTFLLGLGQLAQAGPAGQRVHPRPAVPRRLPGRGGRGARRAPGRHPGLRSRRRGRRARTGSTEQAVQIRVVARGRPLRQRARRGAVTRFPVRPVCAGRAGRGLRTAPHHSATVGGYGWRELAHWAL